MVAATPPRSKIRAALALVAAAAAPAATASAADAAAAGAREDWAVLRAGVLLRAEVCVGDGVVVAQSRRAVLPRGHEVQELGAGAELQEAPVRVLRCRPLNAQGERGCDGRVCKQTLHL